MVSPCNSSLSESSATPWGSPGVVMLWGARALTRCPLSGSFERDGSRCRRNAPLLWREAPLGVPSPNLPIHLTHPLVGAGRLSYATRDSYPKAFQQRRVWGAGLWPWGGVEISGSLAWVSQVHPQEGRAGQKVRSWASLGRSRRAVASLGPVRTHPLSSFPHLRVYS